MENNWNYCFSCRCRKIFRQCTGCKICGSELARQFYYWSFNEHARLNGTGCFEYWSGSQSPDARGIYDDGNNGTGYNFYDWTDAEFNQSNLQNVRSVSD